MHGGTVPVKNTFIHFNVAAGTAEEGQNTVKQEQHSVSRRCKSDANLSSTTSPLANFDIRELAKSRAEANTPHSGGQLPSSHLNAVVETSSVASSEVQSQASESSYGRTRNSSMGSDRESGSGACIPLDPSLPSIGAQHHASGKCAPCAWNWKPGGCINGRDCKFCHLCADGELKRLRKLKTSHIRAQGTSDNHSDASSASSLRRKARAGRHQEVPKRNVGNSKISL
eukprot:TRINITY_DN75670_c0_g1_i1.p1 TRINITY_DN75670_c0_g1~~TRINITY_DN75670_c0_g1_i1.p1  ORF type:complete len:249 (-),score=23.89 TRINITY_DN75670_c0_g1_i1:183-863(-)